MSTVTIPQPSKLRSKVSAAYDASYLPTLDGWRAVAILAVLFAHGFFAPLESHPRLADAAVRGAYGVSVFFALSGLLICTRLIQEREQRGRINLKSFYVRRCFRILPPYICYILVAAALAAVGAIAPNRHEWLSVLFFWRNYLPPSWLSHDRWYLAHFWSLSVEEQFYVVWPTALVILGLSLSRRVAFLFAIPIALWRVLPHPAAYNWIDPHLDKLLFGAFLAIWLSESNNRELLKKSVNPLVFVLLAILAVAGIFHHIPFADAWLGLVFPVLLAATMLNPSWVISRLLEATPVRWIGRLSYSLYIWQELFLTGSHAQISRLQRFPLNFVWLLIVASLSYYLIERPLLAVGGRIAKQAARKPQEKLRMDLAAGRASAVAD